MMMPFWRKKRLTWGNSSMIQAIWRKFVCSWNNKTRRRPLFFKPSLSWIFCSWKALISYWVSSITSMKDTGARSPTCLEISSPVDRLKKPQKNSNILQLLETSWTTCTVFLSTPTTENTFNPSPLSPISALNSLPRESKASVRCGPTTKPSCNDPIFIYSSIFVFYNNLLEKCFNPSSVERKSSSIDSIWIISKRMILDWCSRYSWVNQRKGLWLTSTLWPGFSWM